MNSLQKRIEEIRKSRQAKSGAAAGSELIVDGLPGWAYYITFVGSTPPQVVAELRRMGWEEAGPDHANVKHASAAGMPPGSYILWVKPAELVHEDLLEEAANRPKPRPLTAAYGV